MGDCFTGMGFILEVMGVLELIKEDYEYHQCNRSSWIRYFKMRNMLCEFCVMDGESKLMSVIYKSGYGVGMRLETTE